MSRPADRIVPLILPGPYIEGLSDKTFFDVSTMLLAHPSLLTQPGIALCYAGRELFKYELFIHPGIYNTAAWPPIMAMLIKAGYHLLIEDKPTVASCLTAMEQLELWIHKVDAWAVIINELWDSALRLKKLHDGPVELELTARTLKDLSPYFSPSMRMAAFIREINQLDYTAAVAVATEHLNRIIQPAVATFSRIRNLEATATLRPL